MAALRSETAVSFDLQLQAQASTTDPTVARYLAKPIKADVSGALSRSAAGLTGSVSLLGKSYQLAVRADQDRTFVQFGGTWYGPGKGMTSTDSSNSTNPNQLIGFLRKYGDELITGKVSAGPRLDGSNTWQIDGTLNADGIVRAAQSQGRLATASAQAALRAFAPLVHVTYAVGDQDHLPRQLKLSAHANKQQLDTLNTLASGSDKLPLNELQLSASLELSNWGQPVTIEAPANPQPMHALDGALLGALMSLGASTR
ncbi:MAG: hypothetical protein ACJ780_02480 [Solirubrobacteraceae bacterium]